uniref:Uncharacterized protein n=1 Tax=Parascaris equorum TaxID=6256 RepID=A0A914R0J0_PAREQ
MLVQLWSTSVKTVQRQLSRSICRRLWRSWNSCWSTLLSR